MALFILLLLVIPINTLAGFIEPKVLSPSSNVHVDVVNHVASSLHSHSTQFQHTWRDYAVVLLLVVVSGSCLVGCCCIVIICLYRRLLFKLVRRDPAKPVGGSVKFSSPSGTPYMIT